MTAETRSMRWTGPVIRVVVNAALGGALGVLALLGAAPGLWPLAWLRLAGGGDAGASGSARP